ncbi:MAG: hypothetical protein KBA90_14175 [Chitinophagaceae bacterium]|nr:hypothetical protein [Chitinophagaceae bacterium]
MSSQFIPSLHFDNPDSKLSSAWAMKCVNYYYYNSNNVNLLENKDIKEIEEFSTGDIDMTRFKKMFTSLNKALKEAGRGMAGAPNKHYLADKDKTGLSWKPLKLIPQKLNSATATIQKILIEIQCIAQDGLAMKKRKEDIEFLKNKSLIEEDLQDLADQMQIGKVEIGSTKHSSKKFSDVPMGLDLTDPDEENIFAKLLYSLNVETANEKALQQIYHLTKAAQVRLLEIKDQFKWGVSVNSGFISSMTGLPTVEYIYAGDVFTPPSKLPDFSDNTHRIVDKMVTVMDMFNYFSNEICDEKTLEEIINGTNGYCLCNKRNKVEKNNWDTFKVNLKLMEVKSIDWVGVVSNPKSKRGAKSFTMDEKKCTEKIWAQNTYRFWWVVNTEYCFGIERLPFSHRTKGQESFQSFSTNIYKSQEQSTVELAIGENIKAIIADIKLEYALIKSLPAGKYIDLRFLRSALSGLKSEDKNWTQQDLINLAFEQNIVIGDTEGFDGKNDGQLKPIMPIDGGLKTEVSGYISVIMAADKNISNLTGINEQLTGQSPNPDMLVGLQKLLINAGINSIHYAYHAIEYQYQNLFNLWASLLQTSIDAGGKVKQAIIDFIGLEDTELLDGLNETSLHNLTVKVLVTQREVERQKYLENLTVLKEKGVLSATDEYLLSGIDNPKERFAYLAVKEKRFMKKQDQIRERQFAQQQQLLQQQGQNIAQGKQVEGDEERKNIYTKGDVQAKIIELSEKLNMSKSQTDAMLKLALQKDRNVAQKDKGMSLAREKANLKQQEAII